MKLALLVFVPLLPLAAQPYPDAAALLAKDSTALDKYLSYQFTADMSMDMTVSGQPVTVTTESRVQGVNPGKFRIESREMGADSMVVSDGQFTWNYRAALRQYTKKARSTEGVSAYLAELGSAPDGPEAAVNSRVIRSETIEADGQAHDCWVVESRIGNIAATPGNGGMEFSDAVWTVWIDKTLGFELQDTLSGKLRGGPMPGAVEMRAKTIRHDLKFNESLPDSLFVFTPPADARETAEFGLPAAGASPARQRAASPRPARAAADGEPQAYVPILNPVTRVEPEYPAAARGKGLQGMVHVLLTLDLSGHVSLAEALSGHELLRPAALEAVRQWSFRPVLRDGHPVYAYTDAIVDFQLDVGDGKAAAAEPALDIAGEMAAAQRIAELLSRMPRSPEQVLADTEQQSNPDRGDERFYALPGLAKAALGAGSLDKAASYAHELLQQAETNTDDWNYGNAIHDGNMVLGLVALRSGDVAQAKAYLLASGKTTGSPQLNSFGPNMRLAKELLDKGERDAVLDYFSLCRSFWKMGGASLDAWSAAVRAGQAPEFGANLLY